MTITDQGPSTATTGEALFAASAADLQDGTSNIKAETSSSGTTPKGEILTGKQEHCKYFRSLLLDSLHLTDAGISLFLSTTDLKREMIGLQVRSEIAELNSPTALRRFGAPFRSEFGEVAPVDSDLPILRYIFVHHVRKFPFLDQAREKEFWQDRLQVVRLPWGPSATIPTISRALHSMISHGAGLRYLGTTMFFYEMSGR